MAARQAAKIMRKQLDAQKAKDAAKGVKRGMKKFANVGDFIDKRKQHFDLTEESLVGNDQLENYENIDENPQFNETLRKIQESGHHLLTYEDHMLLNNDQSDSDDEFNHLNEMLYIS